jgi:hypothetical protein
MMTEFVAQRRGGFMRLQGRTDHDVPAGPAHLGQDRDSGRRLLEALPPMAASPAAPSPLECAGHSSGAWLLLDQRPWAARETTGRADRGKLFCVKVMTAR